MSTSLVSIRTGAPRGPAPAADAPRLYVETYGCQMNVADTDLIKSLFAEGGFAPTEDPASADVILLNTCAVREKAEDKVFARAAALKGHKERRGVVLGITGCMAEHLREKVIERAPYVDVVAGPDAYRRLHDMVTARRSERGEPLVDVRLDREETYEGLDAAPGGDGVSGFVTIQRGCDKFCTFCIVPFTRGRERGTPPREVLRQVRALAEAGYREVTLLGQTVNSYGWEGIGFAELIRSVARVDGIERVRFTSPYPIDFTQDVIAAMAEEPRIAKHVHLPLQSGADSMLARMRRGYTFADYMTVVNGLRQAMPRIAITTDLMVGMSGETDAEHQATVAAMREIRFDGAFTFAYSEREGTHASKRLPDDVPPAIKASRLEEIIHLQEQTSREVMAAHVGRVERVLLHGPSKRNPAELMGRTCGFKAVIVAAGSRVAGEFVDVRIERSTSATLFGSAV